MLLTLRFLAIVLVGLAAGAALCMLLVDRCLGPSGAFYVEYKQLAIRALTVPLPLFGALGSLAALIDGILRWRGGGGTACSLTLSAVALGVLAALLTKLGHFPINAVINTWDPAAPPATWSSVQARWATLHWARTAVATLAFALLVIANLLSAQPASS